MKASNAQIVHDAVNAICNCDVTPRVAAGSLSTHFMDLAHALLPRIAGSTPACCTLADLLTAAYQLGMSRALASVAAGLEGQR